MASSSRLTEADVHAACVSIAEQGERPTALTLLDKLGRGSLTTITKYLNSWNVSDEAKVLGAETLPAIVKLPPELTKDGEELIKKIWSIAKGIADEELDIQRDALKQAELATHSKVEEAFKFSEAQAMKIERLEDVLSDLKDELAEEQSNHAKTVTQLNEAEKVNVGLSKDKDRLQDEINELKKQVSALEAANKAAAQEKQDAQKEHAAALKQKDAEIRALDIQVHELKTSLDSIVTSNDQLKSDLKSRESELAGRTIELEKLNVRYEAAALELDTLKTDLTAAKKATAGAEKLVANLEGQLGVYKALDPSGKDKKS
jgi:chromosome segregation ATPase